VKAGWLGNGRFWMFFWLVVSGQFALHVPLVLLTPVGESVRYLNTISVLALVLAGLAGFQASLGMRKADADDDL
jgi:Ni/Fe-hydrogenase subunit HybB-like protein